MLRLYAHCMPCYLCVSVVTSADESIWISPLHTDSSKQRVDWSCQNMSAPCTNAYVSACDKTVVTVFIINVYAHISCTLSYDVVYRVREGKPHGYFMVVLWYGDWVQDKIKEFLWYDKYVTAIGLTPGGSSTVHIYTQTVHRMQRTEHT
jgi:hypothetical protein